MTLTIESVYIETSKKLRPGLLVGGEKNQIHWKKKDEDREGKKVKQPEGKEREFQKVETGQFNQRFR